jgi:Protein of unknown function (DUF1615)
MAMRFLKSHKIHRHSGEGRSPFHYLKWMAASIFVTLFLTTAILAATITSTETTRLIRNAEKSVIDPQGWAIDLHDVLATHDLEQSKENICAAIAIIDQESGFVADPTVAGLGRISESALRDKLKSIPLGGGIALNWLENNPTPQASFLTRIRNAKTERDLDLAYRSLVAHAGEKSGLETVARFGVFNRLIEERNEIDTAGSMQVSVKFAIDMAKRRRWLPMMLDDVYAVRDQLYTRHGGMYYGVPQLLSYDTGYPRKVFRFADFNAGRYASRNAAIQMITAKLTSEKLDLDGDLLSYDKNGKPLSRQTASERAIQKALGKNTVRADLLLEKQKNFDQSETFKALHAAYRAKTGKSAPFAIIPEINLTSPKIRRLMTTRIFAETVDKRYQACMTAR